MAVENAQFFQRQRQTPRERRQAACQRRGQGDAFEVERAAWEQVLDFLRADAARLRVGGVPPEIVPQDQALRLCDPEHFTSDVAFQVVVEDGRKNGKLHRNVETVRCIGQVLPICTGEWQAGELLVGVLYSIEDQFRAM